jgi:hypothetical protein
LEELLQSSYIRRSRTSWAEAAILYLIHCHAHQKEKAYSVVKWLLVNENARAKLLFMFDANLAWAKNRQCPDYVSFLLFDQFDFFFFAPLNEMNMKYEMFLISFSSSFFLK